MTNGHRERSERRTSGRRNARETNAAAATGARSLTPTTMTAGRRRHGMTAAAAANLLEIREEQQQRRLRQQAAAAAEYRGSCGGKRWLILSSHPRLLVVLGLDARALHPPTVRALPSSVLNNRYVVPPRRRRRARASRPTRRSAGPLRRFCAARTATACLLSGDGVRAFTRVRVTRAAVVGIAARWWEKLVK